VRTRGFTLIELMISIALFGLVAAGAMTLVLSGARAQSHSARVNVAQASLRAAVDFITRDVLMAAAGAPSGTITLSSGTVDAIDFVGGNNETSNAPFANGTDKLELWNVDGTTAAQLAAPVAAGAGSLPISYEQAATGATGLFAAATTPFVTYVQVFDLNAKSAAVTQLVATSPTALTVSALPLGFAANAWVMPSRHVTYFVQSTYFTMADSTLQNTSMLMMSLNGASATGNAQPLAEGVEDLQLAYGFDTDGDGVVREIGAAADDDEWLYNVAGDTVQAKMVIANLRTVRVTLVVKSTSVDSGQTSLPARPAAEDHVAGSSDGFIRRVLRTEVAVRNFNL
jgi:type IV pilus assembly protein PilW